MNLTNKTTRETIADQISYRDLSADDCELLQVIVEAFLSKRIKLSKSEKELREKYEEMDLDEWETHLENSAQAKKAAFSEDDVEVDEDKEYIQPDGSVCLIRASRSVPIKPLRDKKVLCTQQDGKYSQITIQNGIETSREVSEMKV